MWCELEHQRINCFFSIYLLALCLGSRELSGRAAEKDSDKGVQARKHKEGRRAKALRLLWSTCEGRSSRGNGGNSLLAQGSLNCSQHCNDTSVLFSPCCWTCWDHFQLLLFENVSLEPFKKIKRNWILIKMVIFSRDHFFFEENIGVSLTVFLLLAPMSLGHPAGFLRCCSSTDHTVS